MIFRLRFGLDLFAGIRPVRTLPGVPSPLANREGIDHVVVRENVEGLYASVGKGGTNVRGEVATTRSSSPASAPRRSCDNLRPGPRHAKNPGRPAKVTCVDKANVLSSYAYFRSIFDEVAAEYPDVEKDYAYIDTMTAFQVQRPQRYDVLVAENMFGDIISDLAASTVGGLGLSGSGDVGHKHGLFQSSHGSAPDIAGKGIANPVAAILSAGIMLDWLGQRHADQAAIEAGALIERAVEHTLHDQTNRTPDLGGPATTTQLGDAAVRSIKTLAAERTP